MAPTMLTPKQVAERFNVHPSTVARWAENGSLPFVRTPGGHRRFPEESVAALLALQAPEPERAA